jgi:hypothetical protein
MKHMLDLFSGLGGASEAFVNSPGWSVLRIENNPLLGGVPYTVIDDVKTLANNVTPSNIGKIDLIWASPPCLEFSGGFGSPKSIASREGGLEDYDPDMSPLFATMEIIQKVKPRFWIIENVIGSIRYFSEYVGEPRQIIGPYVLYGNFPIIQNLDLDKLPSKKSKDPGSQDKFRMNKRALVPFEISLKLMETIDEQKCITDY